MNTVPYTNARRDRRTHPERREARKDGTNPASVLTGRAARRRRGQYVGVTIPSLAGHRSVAATRRVYIRSNLRNSR